MKRRDILKGLTLLPLTSGLIGKAASLHTLTRPKPAPKRDFFKELDVTPVINAGVTMTFLSGSLMLPEVLEAINSTSHDFANMYELQDKVGAKIAEMLHVEAAMVTSGASCAIVLGTAAAITGTNQDKIKQLPNLPGPRPEVIMQ
jgi:L-seryl-tRNA(Ser) seleniumtransferase